MPRLKKGPFVSIEHFGSTAVESLTRVTVFSSNPPLARVRPTRIQAERSVAEYLSDRVLKIGRHEDPGDEIEKPQYELIARALREDKGVVGTDKGEEAHGSKR